MTQEEKELLIDLSARIPYHVRVKVWVKDGTTEEGPLDLEHNYGDVLQDAFYLNKIKDIKPYLRPMYSMTNEERYEIQEILGPGIEIENGLIDILDSSIHTFSLLELQAVFDWLNKNHFDFRNLKGRGLALEAPKNMYNTNNE